MAFTLEDSYNTGDNSAVTCNNSNWYGQTFTTNSAYTATRVKLKVYPRPNTGTININLYATSSGKPTGASIAHSSADSSSFDADPGSFFAFDLDTPVALSSGVQYAVVLEPVAAGSAECGFRRHVGGTYSGGTGLFSGNQGSSWSTLATSDFMFEIYSGSDTVTVELSGTIAAVSVVENANLFIGVSVELSGTIAAQSTVSGNLGSVLVNVSDAIASRRVVAMGNDQFWYEDI